MAYKKIGGGGFVSFNAIVWGEKKNVVLNGGVGGRISTQRGIVPPEKEREKPTVNHTEW